MLILIFLEIKKDTIAEREGEGEGGEVVFRKEHLSLLHDFDVA